MNPFTGPCLNATSISGNIAREIEPPFGTILNFKKGKSKTTAKATNIALSTISRTENLFSSKTKPLDIKANIKLTIPKIIDPALAVTSPSLRPSAKATNELEKINRKPEVMKKTNDIETPFFIFFLNARNAIPKIKNTKGR